MNKKLKNELISIKTEINTIITELDTISNNVKENFSGIGNDKCSKKIKEVSDNYKKVKKILDGIDYK